MRLLPPKNLKQIKGNRTNAINTKAFGGSILPPKVFVMVQIAI